MKYNVHQIKGRRRKLANERLRQRFRKPIPRTVVPSFFTLMNLFCGFASLLLVSEGKLEFGAWLIVIAGVFDVLDGFMARFANATSEFGIELDSLCDLVSFGAAPAFLLYTYSLHELGLIGIIIAAIPVLCGAVRLARFNVNAKILDTPYFIGLPTPGFAIMVVAFFLTFRERTSFFEGFEYGINGVIIPMVLLLSFLMVSTVPFDKIPRLSKGQAKKYKWRLVLFLSYFVLIILFQEYGLMIVFSVFIAKALITAAIRFWKEITSDVEFDDENDKIVHLDDFSTRDNL